MQHSQVAPEPHDVDFLSGCNISRGTGSTGGNATRCIPLSLSQLAIPPPAPSHIARCISSKNELLQQPVTSCVPPFHMMTCIFKPHIFSRGRFPSTLGARCFRPRFVVSSCPPATAAAARSVPAAPLFLAAEFSNGFFFIEEVFMEDWRVTK